MAIRTRAIIAPATGNIAHGVQLRAAERWGRVAVDVDLRDHDVSLISNQYDEFRLRVGIARKIIVRLGHIGTIANLNPCMRRRRPDKRTEFQHLIAQHVGYRPS
jgi:hypothetical protein